jgi:hypothetical protein
MVEVRRVAGPETPVASGVPIQVAPAAEGYAEAPASAPIDLPETTGAQPRTGNGSAA